MLGLTSLLTRHMKTMARTMYKLRIALKNEENLKELRDLANDIGKTRTNYKLDHEKWLTLKRKAQNTCPQ
jgi:hypothetical protein